MPNPNPYENRPGQPNENKNVQPDVTRGTPGVSNAGSDFARTTHSAPQSVNTTSPGQSTTAPNSTNSSTGVGVLSHSSTTPSSADAVSGDNDLADSNKTGIGARGTAAMDPGTRQEVARKGGLAVSRNKQHMADIGRKGGQSVSKNREHMAEIGRKGGAASRGTRGTDPEEGGGQSGTA